MARGLGVFFDGGRLRTARLQADGGRGMSAAELGRRVGAGKAQILAYEHGRYAPDPPRLAALAQQLGLTPLELADTRDIGRWTLADLRRASGLRASDLTRQLRIAPRSYRRLESEGLVAARSYHLVFQVAAHLGVSATQLESHLAQVPAVLARLEHSGRLLAVLRERYGAPGRLAQPTSDDAEIAELAGLYGRPASVVARLVACEITRLRGVQRRRAALAAVADFGASAAEQAAARAQHDSETARLEELTASLPGRLEAFLRCLLPADVWRALALLHTVRAFGLWLTPQQLGLAQAAVAAIPPSLLHTSTGGVGQLPGYQIAAAGSEHCETYRPWYDALYPAVKTLLQARESQIQGHVPGAELQQHFRRAHTVLFSFDGLLCRLFGAGLHTVSEQLLHTAHQLQLPVGPHTPTDPVGMLRQLVRPASRRQIRRLDHALTRWEVQAADHAEPLPGVVQLLRVLTAGHWRLAVATDHAGAAVEAFLGRLAPSVGADRIQVFGRPADPRLMKPHPHTITLATDTLGGPRTRTLLIGESVADALAAQAAGIQFIALATTLRKARLLKEAGATITVGSLRDITVVVRSLTPPSARRPRRSTDPLTPYGRALDGPAEGHRGLEGLDSTSGP
ncbi:HAD family hydrolase [Streptomyces sp. NPDC001178]